MTRVARSRIGILGILLVGVVIGYVIARTNMTSFSSADAREADAKKEKQTDKKAAAAKAAPGVSPVKARPRDVYFPNSEDLGPDEMRVISLGTGMPSSRRSQGASAWLVELGNGDKFLFDIGSGSAGNLGSLEIPYEYLNKVFISHLHTDHMGDLTHLYVGGVLAGRVGPLHVWGPSGAEIAIFSFYYSSGKALTGED